MQLYSFNIVGRSNEDRIVAVKRGDVSIFAVLDGHGGSQTVDYIKNSLPKLLLTKLSSGVELQRALTDTFFDLDRTLFVKGVADQSGSTATVVVVTPEKIAVASLGDSRCLLLSEEGIVLETIDHSPTVEKERIVGLGGRVVSVFGVDRIESQLAVSRSFGDFSLKWSRRTSGYDPRGLVSVFPDVFSVPTSSVSSVLLATDGLWETTTTKEVYETIRRVTPDSVPRRLTERAATKTTDDVTVLHLVLR